MKKVLLGTSALALVGAFAAPAAAAEWDIRLGGYMEQHPAYSTFDTPGNTDFDGFDVDSDQEFYFRPEITLDNGIKISARMDFEGASSGGVDEPRMIISGAFGSVTLGEDDLASYDVGVAAPDVTFVNINSGSTTSFHPLALGLIGTSTGNMTRTTFAQVASDPAGIKYFTPRFAGFQAGVSYARDPNRSNNDQQVDTEVPGQLHDIFGFGANYSASFGGVDIAASGGYSFGSVTGGDDHEAYQAGLNVGFFGVTVGGSFGEANNSGGTGATDGRTWDAGVAYEVGPWGFSFTYLYSEQASGAGDLELDEFLFGVNYDLAQGVALNAWVNYADYGGAGQVDTDGFVVGTGIKASF